MKKCGMWDFREKGVGMPDQDSRPFQTLSIPFMPEFWGQFYYLQPSQKIKLVHLLLISLSKLLYHCFHEPMRTFIFRHLSNDCQIACPALTSFPRNRTPYNKHLISLVFSVLTVNIYISFFFANDLWPMCEKNEDTQFTARTSNMANKRYVFH